MATFDPVKDIEVLKGGAFGSGVAATASILDSMRKERQLFEEGKLLDAQRTRQLIRQTEEDAAKARQEAENKEKIEAVTAQFFSGMEAAFNDPDATNAERLVNMNNLQQNPYFRDALSDKSVKSIYDARTSDLEKRLEKEEKGLLASDKFNKQVVETFLAEGNTKAAKVVASAIQDPTERQEVLKSITTKVTEKQETRRKATQDKKKGMFEKAQQDADNSLIALFDLTGQTEPELEGLGGDPTDNRKTVKNPQAMLNLARSNFTLLFGPDKTEELFKDVNLKDPSSLENLVDKGRSEIASSRSAVAKQPRTLMKWELGKGVSEDQEKAKESKKPKEIKKPKDKAEEGLGGGINLGDAK